MFSGKSDAEAERFERDHFADTGAVIMGRTTFDLGVGPWGENPTFHAPCFVVSHAEHERITKEGGTSYTFVTGGVERALEEATAAAGDKDVVVMGGASIAQQFIERRVRRPTSRSPSKCSLHVDRPPGQPDMVGPAVTPAHMNETTEWTRE